MRLLQAIEPNRALPLLRAAWENYLEGECRDMKRFADRFKRPVARALLGIWIAATLLAVVANVRAWADDPTPDPGGSTTGAAANAASAGSASAFSADDPKK